MHLIRKIMALIIDVHVECRAVQWPPPRAGAGARARVRLERITIQKMKNAEGGGSRSRREATSTVRAARSAARRLSR